MQSEQQGWRPQKRPGFSHWNHKGTEPLELVTFNATAWPMCKKWLEGEPGHIICVQEHRLTASAPAQALNRARKAGWKDIFGPAKDMHISAGSKPGSSSGGTDILVKEAFGIRAWKTELEKELKHIVTFAIVEPPGAPPIMIVSVYMVAGVPLQHAECNWP